MPVITANWEADAGNRCLDDIRPDLVTWRDAHVDVETSSPVTRGVMVADLLTTNDPPAPNCRIAVDVDEDAFLGLFLDRVRGL